MSLRKTLGLMGLAAVIAGASYNIYSHVQQVTAASQPAVKLASDIVLPRSRAPDFSAASTDDRDITLNELVKQNDYVLLDFWATWCGPCKWLMPHIEELYVECKPYGLEVVSVVSRTEKKDLDAFLETHSFPHPVVYDDQNRIYQRYGIKAVPSLVLIKNGIVQSSRLGSNEAFEWLPKIKKEVMRK